MIINADTKIAAILKKDPAALESIISISPRFTKLRNPLLRKLMAGRTSLQMAANIGGCTLQDFYDKLRGPHFEIGTEPTTITAVAAPLPAFMKKLDATNITELDVRPMLEAGNDPLSLILDTIKTIEPGQALKIINTFEPAPLISLLGKKGFHTHTNFVNDKLVETYFYKSAGEATDLGIPETATQEDDWQTVLDQFEDDLIFLDVRQLEMPLPLTTILEALENLQPGKALFIYHKRIPVFLLPELADRNLEYRIKEMPTGDVHLIIYNPQNVSQ